jgi:hypothetical protein
MGRKLQFDSPPAMAAIRLHRSCNGRGRLAPLGRTRPFTSRGSKAALAAKRTIGHEERCGEGRAEQPRTQRAAIFTLFTDAAAFPGMTFIKGGSLDDPSWLQPTVHIWCDSAQPWDAIPEGATCVPKNPG